MSHPGAWVIAGTFLAVNVLVAGFASQGWGFAVVIAELIVIAALVAATFVTDPCVGEMIVGLTAVGVVVIVPFALVLPSQSIESRTVVTGTVQLVAVGLLARYRRVSRRSHRTYSPVAAMPWIAWPITVVCGLVIGLLAHQLIHFDVAGNNSLSSFFWELDTSGRVKAAIGVVVLAVVVEEALFRFLLAPLTRAALGSYSIVFDGALYATFYAASGSAVLCLVALVAGTAASWFRLRYGRMGPLLVAHALASTLALVVIR